MPSTPQARCAGARAERLVADGEDGDSGVASINSRIVAAPPVPYLPRLRALALFGRRSVEREEPPRCRRPKTCTTAEIKTSVWVALVQCLCNLSHQFAFGIGLLKYSRFA